MANVYRFAAIRVDHESDVYTRAYPATVTSAAMRDDMESIAGADSSPAWYVEADSEESLRAAVSALLNGEG